MASGDSTKSDAPLYHNNSHKTKEVRFQDFQESYLQMFKLIREEVASYPKPDPEDEYEEPSSIEKNDIPYRLEEKLLPELKETLEKLSSITDPLT
ncbi:hypothetical protein PSHT_09635 [Puccinia striiformis]|uniref:Uncharacterized protein n=1 Tax=Puccinia striiformis TaxID=27350 RepID=A0A2S4VF52_9BASI|nr:hypothetical protein PSHT_09635 [Puccinia striiformis]